MHDSPQWKQGGQGQNRERENNAGKDNTGDKGQTVLLNMVEDGQDSIIAFPIAALLCANLMTPKISTNNEAPHRAPKL